MSAGNTQVAARAMSVGGGSNLEFYVAGTSGSDVAKGVFGTVNTLAGYAGNDQLVGGSLADDINSGDDADKLRGDGGADLLTGGLGADVFKYRATGDSTVAAPDTIADFSSGVDKLNFKRIDTNAALAGDQAFAYIGTAAFSANGTAQIRWVDLGADLRVEADLNGNGTADMHILLQGAGNQVLTANDFVL